MKKVPAGTLLIPMLLSALINTLSPGIFESFGGITEAFLSARGTSYIVGLVCFCSATLLDIKCRMLLPVEVNEDGEEVSIRDYFGEYFKYLAKQNNGNITASKDGRVTIN